jgi:transcriptional regulator with XRE-family HTH domain
MIETMQPEELTLTLTRNIRARRKELGITQVELAERTGFTQGAISAFERGDSVPSIATLAKLAEALETQPDALLRTDVFSKTHA